MSILLSFSFFSCTPLLTFGFVHSHNSLISTKICCCSSLLLWTHIFGSLPCLPGQQKQVSLVDPSIFNISIEASPSRLSRVAIMKFLLNLQVKVQGDLSCETHTHYQSIYHQHRTFQHRTKIFQIPREICSYSQNSV